MSHPGQLLAWSAWFLVASVAAAVSTSWLVGWAASCGVIDRPNDRSSHTRATPRGGGISIVAVTTWAAIIAGVIWPACRWPLAALVVPALAIASVSWLDDLKTLPNRVRFGVHIAAAMATIAALRPMEVVDLGPFGRFDLEPLAWPLALLWIVGMTNAFNFMDGIDGIAGITAAVAGGAIAAAAGMLGAAPVAAVALAFAGGSVGFLSCNWPPARIFMGDVGSAFCGFMIAALPLAAGQEVTPRLVPITAVAMWPFIIDTIFTLCRRLWKRENIFRAHRSHLYQRLVIAGWSHRAVSTLYGFLSAVAAAIAVSPLCGTASERTAATLAVAVVTAGVVLLAALVHFAERSPGNPYPTS